MNLKEAFRFQNKISGLIDETQDFLMRDSNVVKVETTYLRKKVMAEADDEAIVSEHPSEYCEKVNEMMAFFMYLLQQKEALAKSIHDAKAALPIDMDSETTLNACRQKLARTFSHLAELRPSESTIAAGGVGYRFNAEGNQVTYRCDIRKVTTINFDRNKARKYLTTLNRKSDEMSVEIDKSLINSVVAYEAPFDVNDSFADVFEAFIASAEND